MTVTAKLNYLRIAPRKVRLVADLIRGKNLGEAKRILTFTNKKTAQPLLNLLNSAIASAKHNFQLDPENLWVAKILVNEGPKLKRWMPRARGQASEIQRKTSHITLVLDEIGEKKRKPEKEEEKIKPEVTRIEEIERAKKVQEIKEKEKVKPKIGKPRRLKDIKKPIQKGIKRIFRRKAF